LRIAVSESMRDAADRRDRRDEPGELEVVADADPWPTLSSKASGWTSAAAPSRVMTNGATTTRSRAAGSDVRSYRP
jgi:hypothetical protein